MYIQFELSTPWEIYHPTFLLCTGSAILLLSHPSGEESQFQKETLSFYNLRFCEGQDWLYTYFNRAVVTKL